MSNFFFFFFVLSAGAVLGEVKEFKSEQSPAQLGDRLPTQKGNRRHLLGVAGWIRAGKLEMQWSYNQTLHQQATIERLASGFMTALRALIAHCQSPNSGGYTPSDFSARQLSQKRLDKLMGKIKRKNRKKSKF